MRLAPPIPDESARLLDLARYNILDTSPEEVYDRITRIAARLLNVPIAFINFVDHERHWGKAMTGIPGYEVPRADSPCAWAILQDDPLMVPDLRLDDRFRELPAVQHGLRMYTGAPLKTPRGHAIGTLCVVDVQPRTLETEAVQLLRDLAAMVMSELELRRHIEEVERRMHSQEHDMAELKRELEHAHTLEAVTAFADTHGTPEDITRQAAQRIAQAVGADWSGLVTLQGERSEVRQVHALPNLPVAIHQLAEELNCNPSGVTATVSGLRQSLYIDDYSQSPDALPRAVQAGVQAGAWIPLGSWEDKTAVLIIVRVGTTERRSPWRSTDRALLEAAGRSVRAAIQRHEALTAATAASRQDVLTGSGNRRALEEDLANWTPGAALTLALMDLDGFKSLNDTAGHAEGDKALRVFAGALCAEFREEGQVYRLGGDEFVLRLSGRWSEDEVLERLDLAVVAMRQMMSAPLGVSVGVATCEGDNPNEALASADARMYEAKRRRKAAHINPS